MAISEETRTRITKVGEGMAFQAAEERRRVVVHATHLIQAIRGRLPGVQHSGHLSTDMNTYPDEIPQLQYTSVTAEEGLDGEDMRLNMVGSVGDFLTGRFHNEKPATVFNTGFYAGVLAAKQGLVNLDDFHTAWERIEALEEPTEA